MKRLNLLLVVSFVVFSCSDGSSENDMIPSEIIGRWDLIEESFFGTDYQLSDCEKNSYIIFNENGTYMDKNFEPFNGECIPDGDDEGPYTIDENQISITYQTYIETAVFTIVDDVLTLDFRNEDQAIFKYKKQ